MTYKGSLPEGAFHKFTPTKNTTKEKSLVVFVFFPAKYADVRVTLIFQQTNCRNLFCRNHITYPKSMIGRAIDISKFVIASDIMGVHTLSVF